MTGSDSALRAALRFADATGAPSDRQAAERALRLAGLRSDPVCVDYVRLVPLKDWDAYVDFLKRAREWHQYISALDRAIYAREDV